MASTSEQLYRLYPLADIQQATKNFDDGLLVGRGGFGKVYKGDIIDESGSSITVAIKRLDSMSDQGAPEFRAEIDVLSKLRHAHLVSLLGCCEDGKEMILVYEYMPNGTLYQHLHNSDTPLSWMQRLKIGIGAARGLDYLHTGVGTKHGIIHRDVKSSNILLDEDWAAKISDFGLAKLCPINQLSTYVHTGIKGTFGYLDPEIFMTGKFTRKTDVFAFGVVLFELLSGRQAVLPKDDEDLSLARWAQNCVKGKKLDQIAAAEIRGTLSPKCLKEFAQTGYRCLHSDPKERPTMSEVVVRLQLSLALQEKFENYAKPAGLFGLTWKMPSYIFAPKKENSGHSVPSDDGGGYNEMPTDYDELEHANPRLSNPTNNVHGEQVAAGWPAWLSAVAGEAINGWIPRRPDTFEKIDKIGEGTYSIVYKARDTISGKIVALKKVRFDNLEPESVKFVAREIIILRRLDHPNVVKLEGLITSRMSSSLYLVFEYMEHDLVHQECPTIKFTEPQVKCYMHQLLSGLEHCHNRYVLHRDIKGSNLLLDSDGSLKIADFSSASFFDPNRKQPMTSRVVTVWYRPPELLLGATYYGVGIDLWSAGCILGELLVGKPIMPGRTEVEQLHKIFKLCGSPSEEYWKSKLPHATIFKPQHPYKRCISETFENFSPSSLSLIDTLLAIDPVERQTATVALRSEFFMTKPYACDPSSLPRYPPSKEMDAKVHDKEARGLEGHLVPSDDGSGYNGMLPDYGELEHANPRLSNLAKSVHGDVDDTNLRPMTNMHPLQDFTKLNNVHDKDMGLGKKINKVYSGALMPSGGSIEDMIKEHERQLQAAVRKAMTKSPLV